MDSVIAVAVVLASMLSGPGQGQNFVLVEEPSRLPADTSLPGTSSTDVDLVDVDADTDLDLFVAEGTDSPEPRPNRLLRNDGRGVFVDVSATALPSTAPANSTKADFADVDGDGDLDAIVANLGPEQLLLNDGTGTFVDGSGRLPLAPPLFEDITADARFADLDEDGDLDVLLANENPFNPSPAGGAQNRVWINDGSATFSDETASRLPAATDQSAAMLPGDVDGDGDVDLVVLNRGQDVVLVNAGDGTFSDETAARFPVTEDSSRGGGLADLDGDGDLDVIVGNSRNEPVALYLNDGGVFSPADFDPAPLPGETITGVELVDLDGDGDLDVYLPNAGVFVAGHGFEGGPDRYLRNNGRAKFADRSTAHLPGVIDPTTDAAFGDIDGDHDLDLVVGNSGENGAERVFVQTPIG